MISAMYWFYAEGPAETRSNHSSKGFRLSRQLVQVIIYGFLQNNCVHLMARSWSISIFGAANVHLHREI